LLVQNKTACACMVKVKFCKVLMQTRIIKLASSQKSVDVE